jgi:hypothetical protein
MKRLIILLLAMGGLAACSAEVDGGSGGNTPAQKPVAFPHQVDGPIVEGTWTSACIFDSYESAYKIKRAEFKGQNIVRTANLYSDSSCAQLSKKDEVLGLFRWAKETGYGGFQVDYKLDLGGGWTSNTGEEILIENGSMYLSDFRIGFGRMDKTFPMKSSTAANPSPKPTPGPTPTPPGKTCADFTGTYASGKYYTSLSQNQCAELSWQTLNSDLTPYGNPDVYIMDKVSRPMGNAYVASFYQGANFVLEVQQSGASKLVLNFSVEKVYDACGTRFSGIKTVLMRKGYVNNTEASQYCAYWEKIK